LQKQVHKSITKRLKNEKTPKIGFRYIKHITAENITFLTLKHQHPVYRGIALAMNNYEKCSIKYRIGTEKERGMAQY